MNYTGGKSARFRFYGLEPQLSEQYMSIRLDNAKRDTFRFTLQMFMTPSLQEKKQYDHAVQCILVG